MKYGKLVALAAVIAMLVFLQGCAAKQVEKPVKVDTIVNKISIESLVCRQEANWLRVTGNIKNNSEYPVTSVEGQLTLNGGGGTPFDSRLIDLTQGKRLEPGEVLTFDSTFDYGKKTIPQLTVDAKITRLKVLPKPQP
ncbi:hypothetical protein Desca_1847 [Desulfotomaculum nigrificans CO-1-SRB]|uniref:Lipoprotein n=1 Tax=Desulfotomaculum nigrificans (strain DSM 14880 / VKM B-2319 / CO-1-SRB) TaxID=868595 RepID=F6B8C7_DESCC|nr:hypothetical protein [Desulfotomaculum nigrificans]AEF94691.1 hypothetical protein Desca_1847 [Desulfotomaculum nigrificans CO-1-SRB]